MNYFSQLDSAGNHMDNDDNDDDNNVYGNEES